MDVATESNELVRQGQDVFIAREYSRLLMLLDHEPAGLWNDGQDYYVVGPHFSDEWMSSDEARTVLRPFYSEYPLFLPSLKFASTPPDSAREVHTITASELTSLRGIVRTRRDVVADLRLLLGHDFPEFQMVAGNHPLEFEFKKALDPLDRAAFLRAIDSIQLEGEPRLIEQQEFPRPIFDRGPSGDIALVPSWGLPVGTPRAVRDLLIQEEEFWLENREDALSGKSSPTDFLKQGWRTDQLRCVIDSGVGNPENLRLYLSLFDVVTIALPLASASEEVLSGFGITSDELYQLLGTGRVQVLFPQSLDRYDINWVARAAEDFPDALLCSRRLACITAAEARRRNPLLYPALNPNELSSVARNLRAMARDERLPEHIQRWISVLARELPSMWHFAALAIHREGAMQTARYGMGWLAAQLYKEFHGRDLLLEIVELFWFSVNVTRC